MRWRDAKKHREVKNTTPHFLIASIPARLKAFTIDSFMLLMPILYIVFYVIFGSREGFQTHMLEGWLFVLFPYFLSTTLFFLFKGQTPGYKAYDIILVNTYTLKKANFIQLLIRFFLFLVAIITLIGLLVPFFRKDKLSLYDIFSSTMAIENPKI